MRHATLLVPRTHFVGLPDRLFFAGSLLLAGTLAAVLTACLGGIVSGDPLHPLGYAGACGMLVAAATGAACALAGRLDKDVACFQRRYSAGMR